MTLLRWCNDDLLLESCLVRLLSGSHRRALLHLPPKHVHRHSHTNKLKFSLFFSGGGGLSSCCHSLAESMILQHPAISLPASCFFKPIHTLC